MSPTSRAVSHDRPVRPQGAVTAWFKSAPGSRPGLGPLPRPRWARRGDEGCADGSGRIRQTPPRCGPRRKPSGEGLGSIFSGCRSEGCAPDPLGRSPHTASARLPPLSQLVHLADRRYCCLCGRALPWIRTSPHRMRDTPPHHRTCWHSPYSTNPRKACRTQREACRARPQQAGTAYSPRPRALPGQGDGLEPQVLGLEPCCQVTLLILVPPVEVGRVPSAQHRTRQSAQDQQRPQLGRRAAGLWCLLP